MSQIFSTITSISHQAFLMPTLLQFKFVPHLNFNLCPAVFILNTKHNKYAVAKWVSPKRTRSYPFARVYNTLSYAKKISIISLVKDEGHNGERDFLQFDTVSLLSLFDVYVIIAYYDSAQKVTTQDKITKQQFNNQYLSNKIMELENFHSSALHWNLQQLNPHNLADMCAKTINAYAQISAQTGVKLHSQKGMEQFKAQINQDVTSFKQFSRQKSLSAQNREFHTIQPKEQLSTFTKAKITLTNYLGGEYFLTVDEVVRKNNLVYVIESKHTARKLLPSNNDIKDALLKIIVYANLKSVEINQQNLAVKAVLKLTSTKIMGNINSHDEQPKVMQFFHHHKFNPKTKQLINELFMGAKANNFLIEISQV